MVAALLAFIALRSPQREVVAEKLHDERRVLVLVLLERVELCDGLVKRCLGQGARLIGLVEDLVVEGGEVGLILYLNGLISTNSEVHFRTPKNQNFGPTCQLHFRYRNTATQLQSPN